MKNFNFCYGFEITCLPNRVDERSLNSISRNAIRAMQRYPNSKDLQGKCLALVVNVHEVYDHNIEIFIELGKTDIHNLLFSRYFLSIVHL